jgi:hypothetical protein
MERCGDSDKRFLSFSIAMKQLRAQGATEYLVLLAVVLIIALVSVALLGFFPGMASDARITQSRAYWQSASPIAIIDAPGAYRSNATWPPNIAYPMYLRIKNTGGYGIRFSKIVSGTRSITQFYDWSALVTRNWTDVYLGPGEEMCIGNAVLPSADCQNRGATFFMENFSSSWYQLGAVKSGCNDDGTGFVVMENFGFEYTANIDGQAVTKKQVGAKPLIVRCLGKYG